MCNWFKFINRRLAKVYKGCINASPFAKVRWVFCINGQWRVLLHNVKSETLNFVTKVNLNMFITLV